MAEKLGALALNDLPQALLKYDKDKDYAGIIVYIQREIASLTYLIREKLPKVQVSSHEPTLPEITERKYKFLLTSNGPAGSAGVMKQTLQFANDDAKNLQRNDFLMVDGIYYNGAGTWSTTFTAANPVKEIIRVLDIGNPGATNTPVVVERGWGGDGTGTPAVISTTMNLVLVTSAVGEGSRSRAAFGKTVTTDTNYVQLFREPYEATDFEMDEDVFFNERPEQVNANLASMLLMKKIEFTFWTGIKSKKVDPSNNRVMYTTGGIIPFIPKDTDHHISIPAAATSKDLNSIFKRIFTLGGSNERWLFGGYEFITNLNNAYDDKVRLNGTMVDRYGLQIATIDSSIGGVLHIVPSFALTELGYDNQAFVLDFGDSTTPYFQYMYMDDIFINTGPNGNGIQYPDEFTRKEEFVAKIGLLRRAAQYQSHLYFT